jgi:hypothetical protein
MTLKDSPSLDHIDPLWEEGRDYQLVCGLDCKRNWRELTYSENSAKNNRFLPWRYASDEIGVKPVETGDLVQFLVGFDIEKDVPGEWVLMEFEGKEWFKSTKRHCAQRLNGLKMGKSNVLNGTGFCRQDLEMQEIRLENGKRSGKLAVSRGAFDPDSPNCIKTLETLSAAGKIGGKIAGAKCRDEGIGWCGADEETKREWKRAGGRASKGMLYWNDGTENKRAKDCPGDGWVRGRIKTWN